jgi:hypothetical protein
MHKLLSIIDLLVEGAMPTGETQILETENATPRAAQ